MAEDTSGKKAAEGRRGSRIIGRILPRAVQLWLRSQVEQVAELSVALEGRDRDILSGYLPGVSVSAAQAIYRGLHISELQLAASDIRINAGQVIRGKPLRLVQRFPVEGELRLTADDLTASLASSLLAQGLKDFWIALLQQPSMAQAVKARYGSLPLEPEMVMTQVSVQLGDQCLGLSFYPQSEKMRADDPIILGTELAVLNRNILVLTNVRWLEALADISDTRKGELIEALQGFQWCLGADTQLQQLVLQPQQVLCAGQITVRP